jgi:endonuclease/exonuclease/phosphatase (EEP) superfamily protein YafD
MISPTVIGALVLGVPALFIAYVALFWRRRPIFWFVVALVLVGLGYLASTGALREIGAVAVGEARSLESVR